MNLMINLNKIVIAMRRAFYRAFRSSTLIEDEMCQLLFASLLFLYASQSLAIRKIVLMKNPRPFVLFLSSYIDINLASGLVSTSRGFAEQKLMLTV